MITAHYAQTMAHYNSWQNAGLRRAMADLPEAAVFEDRGAFFGSIFQTANHLLWGDSMWMSRFDGWPKPDAGIAESPGFTDTREAWDKARQKADDGIVAWADGLGDERLAGDLSWFSGAAGREVTKPLAFCVAHFFNHQTHHRGQIHAMLTAAGWVPEDSDLFLMP